MLYPADHPRTPPPAADEPSRAPAAAWSAPQFERASLHPPEKLVLPLLDTTRHFRIRESQFDQRRPRPSLHERPVRPERRCASVVRQTAPPYHRKTPLVPYSRPERGASSVKRLPPALCRYGLH